jgi:antibiotic biosynthesis monooxygenase (ABM) superfamily enzyme
MMTTGAGAGAGVETATRLRTLLAGSPSAEPVAEPVTVTVARVVRGDRREAFERWAAHALALASSFPGNLGATLLHPGEGSSEYHLVYRFADDESLAGWERSPQRAELLAELAEMVDDERYARVSGLDSFFTRPPKPGPRWRMTVLTIGAIFLTTSLLQQFVMPHLASWPLEGRLIFSATVVVLAMAYVVMPALTRIFAPWVFPRRD